MRFPRRLQQVCPLLGEGLLFAFVLFWMFTPALALAQQLTPAANPTPILVKDLNPRNGNANPRELTPLHGYLYFISTDLVGPDQVPHDTLWRTNGTPGQQELVKDFLPAAERVHLQDLTVMGNALYLLVAVDPADVDDPDEFQLWKSDGTARGTLQLSSRIVNALLGQANDYLFLAADEPETGLEVWQSRGAVGDLARLTDLNPGPADGLFRRQSWEEPWLAATLDDTFFFAGSDGTATGLWQTNGQATDLRRLYTGAPRMLTAGDTLLFFHEVDTPAGELWQTNGTTDGTQRIFSIPAELPAPSRLMTEHDTLYAAFPGFFGTGWWRVAPGQAPVQLTTNAHGTQARAVDGRLFFTGDDGELWRADNDDTPARVADIYPYIIMPNAPEKPEPVRLLGDYQGFVYFYADDGVHGREIWRSDGTTAGTQLVKDFVPGPNPSSSGSEYREVTLATTAELNGEFFFSAFDPVHGREVWKTNGAATVRITDVVTGVTDSAAPYAFVSAGNRTYFVARNEATNRALWVSDGTAAGTHPVLERFDAAWRIRQDYAPAISSMTVSGTDLYVSGAAYRGPPPLDTEDPFSWPTSAPEIWRITGTPPTAARISDLTPSDDTGAPSGLIVLRDRLYFYDARPPADGNGGFVSGLWSLDIAGGAPVFVQEVSAYRLPTPLGARFVFQEEYSGAVWVSDGTRDGIVRLYPGSNTGLEPSASSRFQADWEPGHLPVLGGRVYWAIAYPDWDPDVPGRFEIWSSDGTAAGTSKPVTLPYPHLLDYLSDFVAATDALYFPIDDGEHGVELWRSDGTQAGTALVHDIVPGAVGSEPVPLKAVGNLLYFAATDDVHGRELWRTDGTQVGTFMVADLAATEEDRSYYDGNEIMPGDVVDGWFYFFKGNHLYRTNGDPGSAELVMAGAALVNRACGRPAAGATADILFFSGCTADYGSELWVIGDVVGPALPPAPRRDGDFQHLWLPFVLRGR